MNRKKKYKHITEAGYKMMEMVKPGSLIKVKWIEDTDDVDGVEWGLNIFHFDEDDDNNIVMLVKWNPEVENAKDIICFTCLWQEKLYSCSTYAIYEILSSKFS
ncbi:hypothetical protein EBU71_09965 [bacterium]|nr:hypothetical protein [Candidatus Elulimicrobium humile]